MMFHLRRRMQPARGVEVRAASPGDNYSADVQRLPGQLSTTLFQHVAGESATLADLASHLARAGWPVFPCGSDKKPVVKGGFQAAVADEEAAWWLFRRRPAAALIGIPTGARSGIAVLDFDAKHQEARDWWNANRNRLAAHCVVRTRSGGLHIYYRHRAGLRNSQGKLARGVDVRGEGGYIIAWWAHGQPILADAPFPDCPPWLWQALQPPPPPPQPPTPRPGASGRPQDRALRRINRALGRAETAPEGQRHDALRAAARLIGGLFDQAGLTREKALAMLGDAGTAAGLPQAEAQATATWGLDKGRESPLTFGEGRRHV